MFNNWINIHDLGRLKEKIIRKDWQETFKKISADSLGKTRVTWSHTQAPPINAWNIPAVRQRWNQMVSGDATIDHVEYVSRHFLAAKENLVAFSPGCGTGGNELRWAETGHFARIDACDLSAPRIAGALAAAEKNKMTGIVKFKVRNMGEISGNGLYDLVITEGALHHFYPMRATLERIRHLLKPGGMLVVNDFVGPSRFQWTPRQLQAANAVLALIPEAYKRRWPDGKVKRIIAAPGRLRMKMVDPSEAAESSLILPLLKELFVTREIKAKGGALTILVFHEIAHHFLQADELSERILRLCFAAEDLLMQNGEIASDYVLGVFQKTK